MGMKKKGFIALLLPFFLFVLVVMGVYGGGRVLGWWGEPFAAGAGSQGQNGGNDGNIYATTTSFTTTITDKYDSDVTVGGTHHNLIGSSEVGIYSAFANGAALSPNPGGDIWIATDGNGSNFVTLQKLTAPNALTGQLAPITVRNGSVSATMFHRTTKAAITSSAKQAIGANEELSVKADIEGSKDREFPYGTVCVTEYNSSEFDSLSGTNFGSAKNLKSGIVVPEWYSKTNSNYDTKAFQTAPLIDRTIVSGDIEWNSDNTVNPVCGTSPLITCYGVNMYYDGGTRKYEYGVQDEDGSDVSQGSFTTSLACS